MKFVKGEIVQCIHGSRHTRTGYLYVVRWANTEIVFVRGSPNTYYACHFISIVKP